MADPSPNFQQQCSAHLDRFFAQYGNPATRASATKALRLLVGSGEQVGGKPEGWAAGIVYFLANCGKWPCGVPGLLNAEFEKFFGVTMSTVYKRAAQVQRALEI